MFNSPIGFQTMGLKRCWITCMAGEHPSLERNTCPWVRPPCIVCPRTEMAFSLRSLLPTFSPCCFYGAGGLILLHTWEGRTASHRDLTQPSWCRFIPASKPNFCPKYLGTNPDLIQGLKLPMTAIHPDFHRSSG